MLNKFKKAQGLPLNTIVIAILVIIVMLVIVVFFTNNVGKSGKQINQVSGCTDQNPALTSIGYTNIHEETGKDANNLVCTQGGKYIKLIPKVKDDTGKYSICCGTPTQ